MNCPNEIELDGVRYVAKDSTTGDMRIVIMQRGWVFVGLFTSKADGHGNEHGKLEDASVIRRWGTTKGLGELAEKGPLPETVLDPCPTVRFNMLTVVSMIDCVRKSWE